MLRAASAEAQDALTDRLAKVSGDTSSIGEELFGAAGVIRQEAAVRRIVTDGSIEPDAKAGLVGSVFGNSVGEATLELLQEAARRRWTSARDLADVLERLGVVALVRTSGNKDARISDELFSVRQLVNGHGDLRSALADPARSAADKRELLEGVLGGKVQPATLLLVGQAGNSAHGTFDRGLEEFQHLAAEAQEEKLATVHTARELDDSERERLAKALTKQYGKTVHLQVVVDPDVVGGLRVEIGDDIIDGTVSGRLEDAQRKLAG